VEPRTSWDRSYARSEIQTLGATLKSLVSAEPFHLITLSHSLEHLPNLSSVVEHVFQFLQPGGLVFLEVPNSSDEYWQLRFWPDPPHVQFFCRRSASKLFQRNGCEVLFTTTVREMSFGFLLTI
jgi:2-polyprenyl-3-methyl-5-hydroxy-6-metoxy-1,4-benzoquinol methylase